MIRTALFLSSALLACAMIATPALAQNPPAPAPHHGAKQPMDPEAMLERHIAHMHDALKVTPQQEALWQPVAQTMRDNEKSMHDMVMDKRSRLASQSAVDDLNAYADITAGHATATRKLADAFSIFYNGLGDDQKKLADEFFRQHKRLSGQHTMAQAR
jgi:hypothetical protein